jgi:hypothetical protein
MRTVVLALAFMGLTAVASSLDPPAAVPSVDEIVQRHVDALGGIGAIRAIHAFALHGTYNEGSFHIPNTYTAQMRPFLRTIGDPVHPLDDISEGYDGGAWEYYPDPGIVVRTVGEAARTTRHSAMFDDALVDYKAAGTTLEYGGVENFQARPAYVLHTTYLDGFKEDLLVDTKTYMIVGRVSIKPMHAFGDRLTTQDVFGDYRPEGGVMMAHSYSEVDSKTGRVLNDGIVSSVEINPNLPRSMFSPPAWTLTPLQTLIARIYDECEDPHAVAWTYHQSRSIVDIGAEPAGDAVDFVGYQCLKMGHADTAVALLGLNVSDHPSSARAHFGLGRALQAAGERERAAAEYRRALALDPNYARARAALDSVP